MSRSSLFLRLVTIIFCVWQMFAVAVYALPDPVHGRVIDTLRDRLQPWVRPYMYATSQWQQWNLFSPDPMRRATEYTIVAVAPDGTETPVLALDRNALRWWRRDDELAALRRVEDNDSGLLYWGRFLQSYCKRFQPTPESGLKMTGRYQILPKTEPGQPQDWWRSWEPEWTTFSGSTVTCREPDRAADTWMP